MARKKKKTVEENEVLTPVSETIRIDETVKPQVNGYYLKLSERYKTAGFVFILVFVLFLGVILVKYNEHLTYDNFVYLFRDFDSINDSGGGDGRDISYEIRNFGVTESYKDGFAICNRDEMIMYDKTGVELFTDEIGMSSPVLKSGDKYLLIYDMGAERYSLYNSITRVAAQKTEFPIVCGSVSDSGAYIITTESHEAKYVTEVYSSALTLKYRIFTDKYVIDCAVSSDGNYVAICSLVEEGENVFGELTVYELGKTEPCAINRYSMSLPLAVDSIGENGFMLLCDDGARFYEKNGSPLGEFLRVGEGIVSYDVSQDNMLLVCSENKLGSENNVYIFNSKGDLITEKHVSEKLKRGCLAASTDKNSAYFIAENGISKLTRDGELKHSVFDGEILSVARVDSGAYVCLSGAAHPISKYFTEE